MRSVNDVRLAQVSVAGEQAFQAAEAGIVDAVVHLRADWDQCGTLQGTFYSSTIVCNAWWQRTITGTGQAQGRTRSVQRIDVFDPDGAPQVYRLVLWRALSAGG